MFLADSRTSHHRHSPSAVDSSYPFSAGAIISDGQERLFIIADIGNVCCVVRVLLLGPDVPDDSVS